MPELSGIFAALCVAMDDQGEVIDFGRMAEHIDDMIEAGIHGLVAASGTGEYAYLSDDERRRLIGDCCAQVGERVPVIAQTTALSTRDCIEHAKFAEGAGADALMVMPPFLEPPNERGVLYHYEAIATSVSIPIVMYNAPYQAAAVSEDMYRKLLAIENLDYIKDSSGDFTALQKLIGIGGGVFSGIDAFAPYALMAGARGMIWGAANFMPHECARLYDLIAAGNHNEALELWRSMTAICLWLGGNRHDVDYLTGVKAATRLTGRNMGGARKPLPPVPAQARHDIRMALSKLPVNRTTSERLVWRDWQEERDWLIRSYQNAAG